MIFREGYLPFRAAYEMWLDHVLRHRTMLDEDGNFKDFSPGSEFVEQSLPAFCDDAIERLPVFMVLESGEILNVISAVLQYTNQVELETDFASFSHTREAVYSPSDNHDEDSSADLLNEFLQLPTMGDLVFPFFNPQFSVIDCRGATFIRVLLDLDDNPLRLAQLEAVLVDYDGPVAERLDAADHFALTSLRDMDEGYEWIKSSLESPFERYNGNSICFSVVLLRQLLESDYPLEVEVIKRKVSDEVAAEKKFRSYMQANPTEKVSRDRARALFFPSLGTRAGSRVWQKVAQDYPQLPRSGRPKGIS